VQLLATEATLEKIGSMSRSAFALRIAANLNAK
jgi:hypothetical protein